MTFLLVLYDEVLAKRSLKKNGKTRKLHWKSKFENHWRGRMPEETGVSQVNFCYNELRCHCPISPGELTCFCSKRPWRNLLVRGAVSCHGIIAFSRARVPCGIGCTTYNDAVKLFVSEGNILVRHHHTRKYLCERVNMSLYQERAWGSSIITVWTLWKYFCLRVPP